jgi:hypothetical protein
LNVFDGPGPEPENARHGSSAGLEVALQAAATKVAFLSIIPATQQSSEFVIFLIDERYREFVSSSEFPWQIIFVCSSSTHGRGQTPSFHSGI